MTNEINTTDNLKKQLSIEISVVKNKLRSCDMDIHAANIKKECYFDRLNMLEKLLHKTEEGAQND